VTTEGRAVTKGHGLQTGAYELLAEHATGIAFTAPAQIVGFQTNGKARVGCGEIPHARRALLGEGDRPGLIHFAAKILREGLFYGNPRSMLCSIRFCPAYHACPYRDG
jgi:hypothetical protein